MKDKKQDKKVPTIRVQLRFETHGKKRADVGQDRKSATTPGMSYSVSQIMSRLQVGMPVSGMRVPIYEGDKLVPDLDKLDLAEREALMKVTQKAIEAYRKELAEKADADAAKKKEKEAKEWAEANGYSKTGESTAAG